MIVCGNGWHCRFTLTRNNTQKEHTTQLKQSRSHSTKLAYIFIFNFNISVSFCFSLVLSHFDHDQVEQNPIESYQTQYYSNSIQIQIGGEHLFASTRRHNPKSYRIKFILLPALRSTRFDLTKSFYVYCWFVHLLTVSERASERTVFCSFIKYLHCINIPCGSSRHALFRTWFVLFRW